MKLLRAISVVAEVFVVLLSACGPADTMTGLERKVTDDGILTQLTNRELRVTLSNDLLVMIKRVAAFRKAQAAEKREAERRRAAAANSKTD